MNKLDHQMIQNKENDLVNLNARAKMNNPEHQNVTRPIRTAKVKGIEKISEAVIKKMKNKEISGKKISGSENYNSSKKKEKNIKL